MIDNEFILTGCRINYQGWRAVAKTMFMFHNETCNIWTHFLGNLFCFGVVIYVLAVYPNMEAVAEGGPISLEYETMKTGNGRESLVSFIGSKSDHIQNDLDTAEINFVQHYQANKGLQIEDVTSAAES